jgi:hypothetical protein
MAIWPATPQDYRLKRGAASPRRLVLASRAPGPPRHRPRPIGTNYAAGAGVQRVAVASSAPASATAVKSHGKGH